MHTTLRLFVPLVCTAALGAQSPAPGLRLVQPAYGTEALLLDASGAVVHSWVGASTSLSGHLMPDGSLIRAIGTGPYPPSGSTGGIQRVAFDGTLLWDYRHDGPGFFAHHDIHPMPNGNVLLIVWDERTAAEAIAAGRDPALLAGPMFLPDSVIEVRQTGFSTGEIVWEWHVWDHLIQDFDPLMANYGPVDSHPELVDINYPPIVLSDGDWNHANGIDYDPIHDWIVISMRSQDEIWIIDHGTTTAEAAGHTGGRWGKGGDLLYRWGNPAAYRKGGPGLQRLKAQHDPRFIPPGLPGAGNLTVFNNGYTVDQSAVMEIVLPLDPLGNFVLGPSGRYGPDEPAWLFTSVGFFSPFVSSAQRLPNGNTLICSGIQRFVIEVDVAGNVLWQYQHPTTPLFQAHYVERNLWVDAAALSAQNGGTVNFDLRSGTALAGHYYLLLGTTSGTAPGIQIGNVLLPVNPDYLTAAMASDFNTGMFQDTIGTLTAVGGGRASLVVPAGTIPAALAGLRLDFAALQTDTLLMPVGATNPVSFVIAP